MTSYRLGVTVIAWVILVIALLGSDAQPQILVLGGIVSIVMACGFIASDLVRAATPLVWAHPPPIHITRVDDEAVTMIARQLRGSRRLSSSLRDTLLSLADERLLDRHGIDRTGHPEAARAVLGPGLIALVEQRRARLSNLTDLHRLLNEIESI